VAPTIDIIVPTRNTRDLTLRCVEAIVRAAASGGLKAHCFVVDNASSDGTAEAVEATAPQATVIRNETNVAYSRACNQGAKAGSAEFILFLNSDAIPRPDSLAHLAAFLAVDSYISERTNRR
jgi:N-acetylglucosaminyl-diphospho-decaprenol L-rhamnosyltransferase